MIKSQSKSLDNNQKIKKTEITDEDQRMMVFINLFPVHAVIAEQLVYVWMDRLCEKYNGGIWHIYELSNGGFYMAPKTEAKFEVHCPGFGDFVELSADGAGLVATLFAVNYLANEFAQDSIIKLYYLIRDYAAEHREAAQIFRAID